MTPEEKFEKLDLSLIRELKQQFISHNLIPVTFTFIQPDVGTLEVTCHYEQNAHSTMSVRVL